MDVHVYSHLEETGNSGAVCIMKVIYALTISSTSGTTHIEWRIEWRKRKKSLRKRNSNIKLLYELCKEKVF